MNFDVNLLSNLMQMFAGRSQANIGGGMQNYPPTNNGANAQNSGGYNNQSVRNYGEYNNQSAPQKRYSTGQSNTYSSTDYSNNGGQNTDYRENNGKQAYETTSFAIENGIGESVKFEQPKRNSETAQANPLLSLLQMMQGGSSQAMQNGLQQVIQNGASQNSDVMSSMLPLLMNLLKKPSPQPNNTNVNDNVNVSKTNTDDKDMPKNNISNADIQENTKDTPQQTHKNVTDDNSAKHNKTQPSFFKPIAFAGYELMSALCKLYLTSSLRHDR